MKKNKAFSLVLLALAVLLTFSACETGTAGTAQNQHAQQIGASSASRARLALAPETLNPHAANGSFHDEDALLLRLLTGTLTERDPESPPGKLQYIGALAELPVVSGDGLTWTYRIKEGLRFADGTSIDAYTFEYAMKMLLDPKLAYPAAEEYWTTVKITGAKSYAQRELGVSWADVGVSAPNRLTLQFMLEEPVPNPVGIEALNVALVHPALYEAGMNNDRTATGYGAMENMLDFPASGPYKAISYMPGETLTLEKNVYYPNGYKYSEGSIAFALGGAADIDGQSSPWMIYINAESMGNPALKDENLRKALYWGLDRSYVLNSVSAFAAYTPIASYISQGAWVGDALNGGLSLYRNTQEALAAKPKNNGYNPSLALEYFEKAYKSNGEQKIVVTITCFEESEYWGILAIAIRDWWMTLFGADRFHLLLELKPMAEAYQSYENGAYELGFGAMTQNDMNVWNTMAVWTSYYPGKLDAFYNREFDQLQYECAFGSLMANYAAKTSALTEMERLLTDYIPAIPLFQ